MSAVGAGHAEGRERVARQRLHVVQHREQRPLLARRAHTLCQQSVTDMQKGADGSLGSGSTLSSTANSVHSWRKGGVQTASAP